jgi:hypothetical protein
LVASACGGAEDTPSDASGAGTSGADSSGADSSGADSTDPPTPCADAAACLDACVAAFDLSQDRLTEVMTLHSATADEDTWVRMARRVGDRNAVGETFAFDLIGFAIVRGGELVCVTDSVALAYDFGHHNWDDRATATAHGLAYTVHIQFDFSGAQPIWTNSLTIAPAAGGAPLADGLPLVATACASVPEGDLNVCQQTRQR